MLTDFFISEVPGLRCRVVLMLCWWVHVLVLLEYYNAIESRNARVPCNAIGMGTIGVGAPCDQHVIGVGVIGKLDSASL